LWFLWWTILNQEGDIAMNRLEDLLNRYASADESERLHLFLTHREIRDDFLRIEVEELFKAARQQAAGPVRKWLDRWQAGLETI
jgi:hypothetical protein